MTEENAQKLIFIIRQFGETAKRAIDESVQLAENAVTILADDAREINCDSSAKSENRLLNKEELTERLGISARTISNMQNEGMPTVNLRGRVLFDYEDILIWAKDKKLKKGRKQKFRVVA